MQLATSVCSVCCHVCTQFATHFGSPSSCSQIPRHALPTKPISGLISLLLYDTPIVQEIKHVHVAIAVGERVQIINNNEVHIALEPGQNMCSWFKCKWCHETSGDAATGSDVKFDTSSPDTMTFFAPSFLGMQDLESFSEDTINVVKNSPSSTLL